jgi:hypothetical protein
MDKWTSVFTTSGGEYVTEEMKALFVKGLLEEAGIPAVILSHKDSAYVMLGDIKVMVNEADVERATRIIKESSGE